jgi:hypothetical protein
MLRKIDNQSWGTYMLHYLLNRVALLSSVVVSLALPGGALGFSVFSASGTDDPDSIQPTVAAFQAALGDPNNGNDPGPLAGGRREINWDGGGNNPATAVNALQPFNVFLNTRGAQFTTPGAGGFVQAPPGPVMGGDGGFELVFGNPTLGETFGVFSELRLFSPIGSNITDGLFFIPGTAGAQPAVVSGFGAIFTDVDRADSTSIEFFDINNNLLFGGSQLVPQGSVPDKSFSFLGAIGDAGEQIFRVRITSGNTPIAASFAGEVDIVAMDDFLFSEPQGVPESGAGIGLIGLGLGFLLLCYRRSLAVS